MHKDYYCAYHHTQIINTFCRCPDCLLPACSLCVRLHSEEHNINKTQPQYDNMSDVFKQVRDELLSIDNKLKSLGKSLVFIERKRKEDMRQLRELLNVKNKELILSFQQALNDLDRRIVTAIYEMDKDFIKEIEQIDTQILNSQRQIERQICGIESEESLKTVISYFQENKNDKFTANIESLERKVARFATKQIYTEFKKDFKTKINEIFADLISISQASSQN